MVRNIHNFRLDIQGLRAIAVLSVVIFHINPDLLSGGFLGVDMFFVISGYLILGFIWKDLNQHKFTLTHFYRKRIYRLAPALFITILATSIVGYFILLPDESKTYIESLFSALFYFSNFYFYSQSDYFNTAMEFSPLLHTWSLSVEEQFYILFPFILLLVYKLKKESIIYILLLIGIISLVSSQAALYYGHNSFAFFASPTRIFQFIIGGLISIGIQKNTFSKKLNDLYGVIGLLIVALTTYLYTPHMSIPGINALWPSLGTALLLYSGLNAGYIAKFLSNSLFTSIGNASYSIYLWHWPLIVFYKLKFSPILNAKEQLILFVVSISLGYLSWKYVEETMRKGYLKKFNIFYTHIFISLLLWTIAYTVFSHFNYKNTEYKEKVNQFLHYDVVGKLRAGVCFLTSAEHSIDFYNKNECIAWKKGKKNYLLLGDSHAAHFYSAMNLLLKKDETLTQVTASGCLPIYPYKWGSRICLDLHKWALNSLIKEKHFDIVILSMANLNRTTNELIKQTIMHILKYTDKVVLLGEPIKYNQSLLRLLAELPEDGDSTMIYKKAGDYKYKLKMDNIRKKYFLMGRVKYISTLDLLCNKEKSCRTLTPKGAPIFFDRDHFTEDGALFILKQVADQVFGRK